MYPEQYDLKVGDRVYVTRDNGDRELRVVRQPPWKLGSGKWVVSLTGISGGYALDRCERADDEHPTGELFGGDGQDTSALRR